MTADLSALIARLEAAEAGSRELDAAVADVLFPRFTRDGEAVPGFPGRWPFAPGSAHDAEVTPVTTSLDAAVALAERVLPGWQVGMWTTKQNAVGSVLREDGGAFDANASTPALALCIATLRAKLDGYEAEGAVNKNPKAQEG